MLFALFAALALAAPTKTYTYVYAGKTVRVPITEVQGVKVNDVCVKKGDDCRARELLRHPPKKKLAPNHGNLAGAYCRALEGTPLFLDQAKNHFQACVFRDLTLVDADALYRAGHP